MICLDLAWDGVNICWTGTMSMFIRLFHLILLKNTGTIPLNGAYVGIWIALYCYSILLSPTLDTQKCVFLPFSLSVAFLLSAVYSVLCIIDTIFPFSALVRLSRCPRLILPATSAAEPRRLTVNLTPTWSIFYC